VTLFERAAEQRIGETEHRRVHDLLKGRRIGLTAALLSGWSNGGGLHHSLDLIHAVADRVGDDGSLLNFFISEVSLARGSKEIDIAALASRPAVPWRRNCAPDIF